MALTDREFATYERGQIRETILRYYRNSLRSKTDPNTGQPFNEVVIKRATMKGSRFWVEAEGHDIIGLGFGRRGDFLAQNVNPERAASPYLRDVHARLAGLELLPASSASGFVRATGVTGTIYQGSTIIPDQFAVRAKDEAGQEYQVFVTGQIGVGPGFVDLAMQAVDKGSSTNLATGTTLEWVNPPPGSAPTCEINPGIDGSLPGFTGGTDIETDAELLARLLDVLSDRPAAGNPAHFRYWARKASVAVEDVFVYPCALNYGSVVVSIVQKRGTVGGPLARIPAPLTLATVTGALTPPVSTEVPGHAYVVVTPWTPEHVDAVMLLGMRVGSPGGFADLLPWPGYSGTPSTIQASPAPTQSSFRINAASAPPSSTPRLMVWNDALTKFEPVFGTVADAGGGLYTVTLSTPHAGKTLTAGDYVSPFSARHADVSASIRRHFDAQGPGELVDLATDVRASRAYRRVEPSIRYNYYTGSALAEQVKSELGASIYHAVVDSITATKASVPATASAGPNLLVPRKIAVYLFSQ